MTSTVRWTVTFLYLLALVGVGYVLLIGYCLLSFVLRREKRKAEQ